jgi:two-component system, chemotaxis family, protein-glutamate methylesterase/glutaminase
LRNIVVIGCSLGGLRALGIVLGGVPRSFPAPIVIVQHRARQGTEDYCATLQRETELVVAEAEDKQRALPGRAYVAPAGYHLLVDGEELALSVDDPVNHARPSIDVLFQSAAESFGPRTVAIVLSGASHDGSAGAGAVLAADGRVIVQDPHEAECSVLPDTVRTRQPSAIVLPLATIAPWLIQHVH